MRSRRAAGSHVRARDREGAREKSSSFPRTRMAPSRTLILLCFSAVCLAALSYPTNANPRPQSTFSRVGDAARANYTVSFVPLISVIANFFPRLLSRFTPQTQHARSQSLKHQVQTVSTGVMEATCYEVHPYKLRWPDPKNRQQFLFCHLDPDCVAQLQKTGLNATASESRCYTLYAEKCPARTVFDFHQQQCVFK